MNLFEKENEKSVSSPLAERMRPESFREFSGQKHLLDENGILKEVIRKGLIPSMIFWGEPGCGKTTLARLIANRDDIEMKELSAVASGVKELRGIIEYSRVQKNINGKKVILFIDEIHRYSKSQQDALLHAVEDGTVTLIGATTENPSFEVIPPLLSRARVLRFEPLSSDDISSLIDRALVEDKILSEQNLVLDPDARETLLKYSSGDARIALNALEMAVELTTEVEGKKSVTAEIAKRSLQQKTIYHDKKADYHYDLASAFIKSLRASDPDAALFYMARMLVGGEDPKFIARRMLILASEDVGNANPNALLLANACFQAINIIGMPEARIILGQCCTYLASSPKSNASYIAIEQALAEAKENPDIPVPLKLRNPVTSHMKSWGYGNDYKYAHNYPDHFVEENNLPDELKDKIFYRPTEMGGERAIKERLDQWWSKRRKKEED